MGSRDHLFKVLVVGDAAVGKTSLVQRYSQDSFRKHYKSTVGGEAAGPRVQSRAGSALGLGWFGLGVPGSGRLGSVPAGEVAVPVCRPLRLCPSFSQHSRRCEDEKWGPRLWAERSDHNSANPVTSLAPMPTATRGPASVPAALPITPPGRRRAEQNCGYLSGTSISNPTLCWDQGDLGFAPLIPSIEAAQEFLEDLSYRFSDLTSHPFSI